MTLLSTGEAVYHLLSPADVAKHIRFLLSRPVNFNLLSLVHGSLIPGSINWESLLGFLIL